MNILNNFFKLKNKLSNNIQIVIVSKDQKLSTIRTLYDNGCRNFGENYIQELIQKYNSLPQDIKWHMIGVLQKNKIKFIIPFIHLIHSVAKIKYLYFINKLSKKYNKITHCLLQVKISNQPYKSGLSFIELQEFLLSQEYISMKNIKIVGLMGIASHTDNYSLIRKEFSVIENIFVLLKKKFNFKFLSIGMSNDYHIAIKYGGNIIRIGKKIFRSNL